LGETLGEGGATGKRIYEGTYLEKEIKRRSKKGGGFKEKSVAIGI